MKESKQLAIACLKLQQQLGIEFSRVPVFVGKTSVGKTYWVANELSKELNLPVVKLLLQTRMPDEVVGFQKHLGGKYLTHMLPSWWRAEPSIIFLDEMDKPREELLSTILTFIRNGEIEGEYLPKGSVIIGAMNESEWLPDPLKARCIFLPFLPEKRLGVIQELHDFVHETFVQQPVLPEQAKNTDNAFFLDRMIETYPQLVYEPQTQEILLKGLFPSNSVPRIQQILQDNCTMIDYRVLLDNPKKLDRFAKTIKTPVEFSKHFWGFYNVGKTAKDAELLIGLMEHFANESLDPFEEVLRNNFKYAESHPEEVAFTVQTPEFLTEYSTRIKKLHDSLKNKIDKNTKTAEDKLK